MKKVVLSLAGMLAATAFAPEASAIPAFARQTGMACSACHQTHFPVLNGFGRAFKASGYTLMGAQGRIEGEGLSIPDTLNAAILMKYRYQRFLGDKNADPAAGQTAKTSESNGMIQMGDELSLFFGGRIAETEHFTMGFLNENNLAVGGLAGLRVPVTTEVGDVKVSVIPFATDSLGVGYSFELASNGITRANRWSEMRRETSAVQYNADRGPDGGAASGTALVVHNDFGYINVTKWSSSFAPGANGGSIDSTNFNQNYIRAAVTPTIGDFAIVAGVGKESGSSYSNGAGAGKGVGKQVEAKQTFADIQVHGDIGGMESGIYVMYAKAPACGLAGVNKDNCVHNSNKLDRSAVTIGGEFNVVPHALTLQASYRSAKNGNPVNATDPNAVSETDNAVMVGGIYDLAQNVALHAYYVKYSGTTKKPQSTDVGVGSQYLMMLESAW
jgi:hypothetical protein